MKNPFAKKPMLKNRQGAKTEEQTMALTNNRSKSVKNVVVA